MKNYENTFLLLQKTKIKKNEKIKLGKIGFFLNLSFFLKKTNFSSLLYTKICIRVDRKYVKFLIIQELKYNFELKIVKKLNAHSEYFYEIKKLDDKKFITGGKYG